VDERVTEMLMMRDAGYPLPADVDLCLTEIERLRAALASVAHSRQLGRLMAAELVSDYIARVKAIAADALSNSK
jgi:hypothetical protein